MHNNKDKGNSMRIFFQILSGGLLKQYNVAPRNLIPATDFCLSSGLSFTEAERRLKENGPNVPVDYSFPSWWHILWNAFFHPFNIILIVLSVISYITSDSPNGCIMLVLVFISVSLRFYQVILA